MRARTPPSLEHLEAILRDHLPGLRQRWGVRSLGIFGSYARGSQRPDSDLDLLVEFADRSLSLLQFIQLEQELTDLLGVKVDLVERDALKPAIGRLVLGQTRPL